MHDLEATVVAVATPPGRGGVGCVRISGDRAVEIARGLFEGEAPASSPGMSFGRFLDRAGRPLDHGYLVLFEAGRSFTGEATAELWTHGSPAVLAELTSAAVAAGARAAEPGEFTYRALRHGRLDLTRAEAIRDLVEARTVFQARVAFAQTEGAVARRLAPLREALEEWIARCEASVEFVDESEAHLTRGGLSAGIARLRRQCEEMLSGFSRGRLVRDGARIVLVGRPNAGKSSLFNRLLADERAIVAEAAGTTRDTLEEALELDGIPVRLVDTAGLRDVEDPVETEGVRRARAARREADLVLVVLDGERDLPAGTDVVAELAGEDARTLVLVNKIDLAPRADYPSGALAVSARTGAGIEALRAELRRRLLGDGVPEHPAMTNVRHARALEATAAALERAGRADAAGLSEELVLEDLRRAIDELALITGEFGTDDLYDRIFSTFCIGK